MKKLIATSMLLASLVAISGPKADIEKANKLFKENKIAEAVEVLKKSKNTKGEEAEYERINYELATRFSNTNEEAISYLKKAAENPKSNSVYAVKANEILVANAKTNQEKIKYLEILVSRPNQDTVDFIGYLAALYKAENQTSKFNELVKKVEGTKRQDIIDNFNLYLGQTLLLELSKESDGLTYLNKAANSTFKNVKSSTYLVYSDYFAVKKDAKKVASYLEYAAQINPDTNTYSIVANRFTTRLGDLKKAYLYAEKAYKLEPSSKPLLNQVFIYAVANKDSRAEAKYAGLIKKYAKNIGIADLLYNNRLLEASEKYAKLALKDNSKEADLILSSIYGNTGKLDLAITHAKNAVKNKVEGAQDILNQLEALKKKAK